MDDVISIPNIGIQKVGVNKIAIPNITSTVPVYQPPPVVVNIGVPIVDMPGCLLYTSPSPRDLYRSRMPSSA